MYDADLQSYFDTIPHDQLLKCLRMRVADRSILALIQTWLASPVIETDGSGQSQVTRPRQRSTPPGVYFRMLLVGYFEGIDS